METETLNEYLFANLLSEWARTTQHERLKRDGKLHEPFGAPTEDDLRKALQRLRERRRVALELLQEAGTEP